MASAVGAFMRAFGIDEPMPAAMTIWNRPMCFVLWGSNMAEMHPILWSRLTNTRLTKPGCEVHVLSTFENRCYELADNSPDLRIRRPTWRSPTASPTHIIETKAYDEGLHRASM